MRVQIPAYTDMWMRGDRYGDVIKTTKAPLHRDRGNGKLEVGLEEIGHVRLDISGKVVRVRLADCTVVDVY